MIGLNNRENATLHIVNINSDVKNLIYQKWDEKLTDEQKFDIMIQAIQMQKMKNLIGEN